MDAPVPAPVPPPPPATKPSVNSTPSNPETTTKKEVVASTKAVVADTMQTDTPPVQEPKPQLNSKQAMPAKPADDTKKPDVSALKPADDTTKKPDVSASKMEEKKADKPEEKLMKDAPVATQSKEPEIVNDKTDVKAKESKKRPSPSQEEDAEPARKMPKTTNAMAPRNSQRAPNPAKRRNIAPPIYDEVWKEVYLAGTEWDQLKLVYDIEWDFDHLDEDLTDGDLKDKRVYLFGATEPQLLMRDEKDKIGEVIPIPVIVAVVSDYEPPSTVGLKSVQRAEEEIVPMSKLRMGWHAYAPPNVSHRRSFKPNVFVLKCNERRARLKNMKEEAVHQYDYVLPYFIRPEQIEDVDDDTIVQVLVEVQGQKAPLMLEYDYEMDELEEFVEEKVKEYELNAKKHTTVLKKAIQENVRAFKLKKKEERLARKKRIDAIPQEQKDAIKNMKLLKYYPGNEWPDVSKVKAKFINRYYGQATKIL